MTNELAPTTAERVDELARRLAVLENLAGIDPNAAAVAAPPETAPEPAPAAPEPPAPAPAAERPPGAIAELAHKLFARDPEPPAAEGPATVDGAGTLAAAADASDPADVTDNPNP